MYVFHALGMSWAIWAKAKVVKPCTSAAWPARQVGHDNQDKSAAAWPCKINEFSSLLTRIDGWASQRWRTTPFCARTLAETVTVRAA